MARELINRDFLNDVLDEMTYQSGNKVRFKDLSKDAYRQLNIMWHAGKTAKSIAKTLTSLNESMNTYSIFYIKFASEAEAEDEEYYTRDGIGSMVDTYLDDDMLLIGTEDFDFVQQYCDDANYNVIKTDTNLSFEEYAEIMDIQ